jgi:hypothetical protein
MAITENNHGDGPNFQLDVGIGDDDIGPMQTGISTGLPAVSSQGDQGPCLYLGPAGQRCYKRAIKSGFCAAHQPGATAREKVGKSSKVLAAIAGIAGVLWPYVYDFVHALLRLIHPK